MRKPLARLARIVRLAPQAVVLTAALSAVSASATVLTFDDLPEDGSVPVNYGGLDWSGSSWFQYAGEQAPFTPHSGDRRATLGWDGSADTSAIRFTTPSTFGGAWFAGYEDVTVAVEMYFGGSLVATTTTLGLSASPSFLASGYAGLIDRIVVRSSDPAFFVMDDLTFASAVPEPSSSVLALAGVGAVLFLARRRRPGAATA